MKTRVGAALVAVAISVAGCTDDEPATVAAPTSSVEAPAIAASPADATPSPTATPSPPPTPTPTPTPRLDPFDAERAHRFAVDLAALGPREAGTDGDATGRAAIAAAFEGAGWTVLTEEVALPQGGTTDNVIAVRRASDLQAPHVVVGGHHDTIGGGPGANDNGSGIGVLVALAEELADEPADVPVVLVAFGAEEYQPSEPRMHHVGSQAYADRHGDAVLAAAIIDMVGNGDRHCICWFDLGPRTMADRFLAAATAEGLADRVAVEARGDISDHGPFARAGIPAAFLWSYPDGVKHTPDDTADRLDVDDIDRAGRIALAFVRSLAAADAEGLRPSP